MPKFPSLRKALKMDEASRLARAKEMGFDTSKTYYHGTPHSFEGFDLKKLGSQTDQGDARQGIFFSEDPSVADNFANYGPSTEALKEQEVINAVKAKYPNIESLIEKYQYDRSYVNKDEKKLIKDYFAELRKARTPFSKKASELDEIGFKLYSNNFGSETNQLVGANIIPAHVKTKNPYVYDNVSGEPVDNFQLASIIEHAKSRGHDSVVIPKHISGKDTVIVFKPEQVRSKYAAFDPDKAGSGDISSFAPTDLSKQNPLEVIGKVLRTVDRYSGQPVRAGAEAVLKGENPLDAAKEAFGAEKDTTNITHELLKRFEEGGLPLRAPGQEEYLLEPILDVPVSGALDPLTYTPIPSASRFQQLRKLIRP